MKLPLYDIFLFFQWGCMIASSIFSLKLVGNKRIPSYMHKFYWYSIIVALVSIYSFLFKYFSVTNKNISGVLHSFLLLFHFIFLSLFIYRALPNKNISGYIKFLFFLFLSFILFCLFTIDVTIPKSIGYAISNFALVLFCCVYYSQLFEEIPNIRLSKEPSFWIISGIFLCMCTTVPLSAIRGYLFNNMPSEFYFLMGTLGSFAYGVMHLFFIKAYLCSINQPKA